MQDVIDAEELRGTIGANVQRLRAAKGWSQQELADAVGVTRVSLNRVENGHTFPNTPLLYSLADALGVGADALRQACKKVSAA
jgi:putative transcriptional regulator